MRYIPTTTYALNAHLPLGGSITPAVNAPERRTINLNQDTQDSDAK